MTINKLFNVGLKENNDLRNYPAIRTHDKEEYNKKEGLSK